LKLEKTIEERKGKTDIDNSGWQDLRKGKVINKKGQHTEHSTNKIEENKEPHEKITEPK
jgi:hypothetical protein